MRSVHLRRTLSAAALVALGLGALAAPAVAADPLVPETREQARILGDGSASADVTAEDESNGSIAPGGVPFVPMDFSRAPLASGEEESTENVEKVASVPLQEGQATMSNLAFKGDYVYQGSYNGFVAYDISDPESPQVVSNTICPGYQGDLSIAGDLLFFSVDQPRNGSECGAAVVPSSNAAAWEGIRIFDISNPASPQYVGNVKTRCGSHTHTLVPKPGDDGSVYLYNAAYDVSATAYYCKPPHQQLEIIEVDLDDPAGAHIAKEVSLWDAENPAFTAADRVDGGANTSVTNGCHDLTAYPAKDLLAAACLGDGVMVDISDPLNPAVTERVRDENYAFWHTAQFSDNASKVVFQDELGGGSSATCVPGTPQYRGANAIYTREGDELTLRSYFKIPRRQSVRENCVGHEGNLVQLPDRDVMIQGWYQGGASLIDFTEATKPKEIGYFDRGQLGESGPISLSGYWAVYSHNGYLYGSEIGRGFDVLKLKGDEFADAVRHRQDVRNPATQEPITWDWKTAPVVPSFGDLPAATVTPESARAGTDRDFTVSVPAGTFDDGEYVDVWSTGADAKVVASGRADADGSISLTVSVKASEAPGTKRFVVRGDAALDEALYAASLELTAVGTTTTLSVSPASQVFGSTPATLTATVTGEGAEGTVTFTRGGTVIAKGVKVSGGKASVRLPRDLPVGSHALRATFVPASAGTEASTSSVVTFRVAKATAKVKAASVTKVKALKGGKLTVKVTATGTTPTGKITVTVGGKKAGAMLKNGKATVKLPRLKAGTYRANVAYGGSASVAPESIKVTIKVTR
ncbi:Ig-like domain repeat protein [Aeromicrobium sp. Marseille-Q0843]|uniref:Ig-like domain repeat protein n=1 Tax=Aeromicrobium phoceense TaxID=2754045 RepID=A0A838XFF6_9ACTN|nr:Ig-like domain repeat protein [Aeromicrobium phoceense]MBA4608722.1 Ig-like domain repeat protein [Aeromicrobium phoceense]